MLIISISYVSEEIEPMTCLPLQPLYLSPKQPNHQPLHRRLWWAIQTTTRWLFLDGMLLMASVTILQFLGHIWGEHDGGGAIDERWFRCGRSRWRRGAVQVGLKHMGQHMAMVGVLVVGVTTVCGPLLVLVIQCWEPRGGAWTMERIPL